MDVLKINGVKAKTPTSLKWSLEPVSTPESGRTLDAVMHNEIVAFKTKLVCQWAAMPVSESSVLLKMVYSKNNCIVTYLDPMEGDYQTKTFYVGPRSSSKLWETAESQMVADVAFDFIEV